MTVVCTCGTPDCPELGWPHDWDPIAAGDSCILASHTPHDLIIRDGQVIYRHLAPHQVTAPYVRLGCGHACQPCYEAEYP